VVTFDGEYVANITSATSPAMLPTTATALAVRIVRQPVLQIEAKQQLHRLRNCSTDSETLRVPYYNSGHG
jgi:hypothetical protein